MAEEDKKFSQFDLGGVLRSAHEDKNKSLRVTSANTTVPASYSRVSLTYNSSNSVTNATFYEGSLAEERHITFISDVGGSLNNDYFTLYSENDESLYHVWYNVGGSGVDPAPAGSQGIEIPVATNDPASIIKLATQLILGRFIDDFKVQTLSDIKLKVTNARKGPASNSADVGTGFTITTVQQGEEELVKSIDIPYDGTTIYKFNVEEKRFETFSNVRGAQNHVLQNELPFGTNLELRKDTSKPGRTIYGWAKAGTSQTAASWLIYAEDQIGTRFHRQFAEVASVPVVDFVHQWSNRNAILPDQAFLNAFSIQFSGDADSNASAADSPGLDFNNTDAFSFGIWIKSTMSNHTIFQKTDNNSGNNGYTLTIDGSGRYEFQFRGTGAGDRIRVRTDNFTSGNDGTWNFVMVTKASGSTAASSVKIYTGNNGTLTDETLNVLNDTLSGTTTNANGLFVASKIGGGNRYQGNIDEFSIHNAELTSLEVQEIYNLNNGVIDLQSGSGQISSALVSWWRWGDGSFTAIPTIPDEQGTNDMTLGSAVTSGDVESEVPP